MTSHKLLYFSPTASGGLADYARVQANAIAQLGVQVDLVSYHAFPVQSDDRFKLRPELSSPARGRYRIYNRWNHVRSILRHYRQLAHIIETENYSHVLLGAYAEYLSPLWAGRFRRLARRGVIFGSIVHDPVRDYVVGPLWWHRRSIAGAYSFVREAFVHESITLDTVQPMPKLRITVIPHGIYAFPPATASREQARLDLGIPKNAQVWLSFGHVRDGKNLDLVIRALAHFPDAMLVVAGKQQSSGQKPIRFYQDLAQQAGVAQRCLWLNRFIAPGEVGNLFAASDIILLTYSKDFRSASGVLNTAINFRKPCVASSGQGNLRTMVSKYDLGVWVEPNQVETLIDGIRQLQSSSLAPRWDDYEADNSWQRNAELVIDRMFGPPA